MVEQTESRGDNIVQCPEISSSLSVPSKCSISDQNFKMRPFRPFERAVPFNYLTFRPLPRQSIQTYDSSTFQNKPSESFSPSIYAPTDQQTKKWEIGESTRAVIILLSVFVLSSVILATAYYTFPELEANEKEHIKLPRNYDDVLNLGRVLERYKDKYYFQVMSAMVLVFIFLQTFAIPGSIFLSVLSGFLYPFVIALGLVCFCSATGATFCYLLSRYLGRKLVYKYFPNRATKYALLVRNHKDDLLSYIIFLRITPFLPNWFINIAAPVVDVPITPYFVGTFLGVAPPSFVAIQGGKSLHELTKSGNSLSYTSIILLAVFATISLIPVFLRTKLRTKFE